MTRREEICAANIDTLSRAWGRLVTAGISPSETLLVETALPGLTRQQVRLYLPEVERRYQRMRPDLWRRAEQLLSAEMRMEIRAAEAWANRHNKSLRWFIDRASGALGPAFDMRACLRSFQRGEDFQQFVKETWAA